MDRRNFLVAAGVGVASTVLNAQQTSTTEVTPPLASDDLFGAKPDWAATTWSIDTPKKLPTDFPALYGPDNEAVVFMSAERSAPPIATAELSNQFIAFQLTEKNGKSILLESSAVEPEIETPDATPDVVMDARLEAFHLGDNEPVAKDARATLRLTINKADDSPRARNFETLYWAVTAGLKLHDDVRNKRAESQDLNADFRKALGNKYIEIPGALGEIKFEVIRHREPSWWKKVFTFADSPTGKALTAALGFPAVTQQVVRFVDEAANRLENTNPEVLFASRPLKFAFSKQARKSYVGSGPVNIGALNPGRWVLARGRDFKTLANAQAWFWGTYGRLVPGSVTGPDVVGGSYPDPFKNITYAVVTVQAKAHKLDFELT